MKAPAADVREAAIMTQLVYVHGSGHTYESFSEQLAAFPGSDAVSLPGHPEGRALESVGDCAVWLSKYLRWKGPDTAIVAGNSLGGAIALEWALRYPESAAGLILLGSGARLRVSQQILDAIDALWPECIDMLVDFSLSAGAPDELRARVRAWHLTVGQASTKQDFLNCNAFDAMDRVQALRVPTLIVVGAQDVMTPPKYSQFLHERMPGSTLLIVDGAGHMVHAEKPDAVNSAIRQMFQGALA